MDTFHVQSRRWATLLRLTAPILPRRAVERMHSAGSHSPEHPPECGQHITGVKLMI